MRGDESLADDLVVGHGRVRGRVALLLRSTERQPFCSLDFFDTYLPFPSVDLATGRRQEGKSPWFDAIHVHVLYGWPSCFHHRVGSMCQSRVSCPGETNLRPSHCGKATTPYSVAWQVFYPRVTPSGKAPGQLPVCPLISRRVHFSSPGKLTPGTVSRGLFGLGVCCRTAPRSMSGPVHGRVSSFCGRVTRFYHRVDSPYVYPPRQAPITG